MSFFALLATTHWVAASRFILVAGSFGVAIFRRVDIGIMVRLAVVGCARFLKSGKFIFQFADSVRKFLIRFSKFLIRFHQDLESLMIRSSCCCQIGQCFRCLIMLVSFTVGNGIRSMESSLLGSASLPS